jgi:hypothetical protein
MVKCRAELDLENVKWLTPIKGSVVCKCGKNNFLTRSREARGYSKDENGSMCRKVPRVRMSKKQRRKERAEKKGVV